MVFLSNLGVGGRPLAAPDAGTSVALRRELARSLMPFWLPSRSGALASADSDGPTKAALCGHPRRHAPWAAKRSGTNRWPPAPWRRPICAHTGEGRSSAESALGWAARRPGIDRRPHVLVAEVDTTLVQVVGRHFHGHAIAGQDTDAVLFHAPGGVGDDFMPVIELHATARVRQHLRDHTFELQHLFLGHAVSLLATAHFAACGARSLVRLRAGRGSMACIDRAVHLPTPPSGFPCSFGCPYMGRRRSAGKRKRARQATGIALTSM